MGLVTGEDARMASVALRALRDIAAALEAHQVARARQLGMTWAEIGPALGVSAQGGA